MVRHMTTAALGSFGLLFGASASAQTETRGAQIPAADREEQRVEPPPAGHHNELFAAIDDNNDGYLTEEEYVAFISTAENVSEEEARIRFEVLTDGDDRMTLAQLVEGYDRERLHEMREEYLGIRGPEIEEDEAHRVREEQR